MRGQQRRKFQVSPRSEYSSGALLFSPVGSSKPVVARTRAEKSRMSGTTLPEHNPLRTFSKRCLFGSLCWVTTSRVRVLLGTPPERMQRVRNWNPAVNAKRDKEMSRATFWGSSSKPVRRPESGTKRCSSVISDSPGSFEITVAFPQTGRGRPPQKNVFGAQDTARSSLCERVALPVARHDASLEAQVTG